MAQQGHSRPPPRLGGGRFRIIEALGDGGTATVYLAWDDRENQWCALKALQKKFLNDDEMRRRFAQEADALAMFYHPNIPQLIFHSPDSTPPFMVMELARGGSVMDWVRDHGPMTPTMAADILFQVCQALAEAHAVGMIHRDVKPHNFLLDDDGVCKLTDFGIARWADSTSLTATGSQIGTFSFMAPEQRSDTKSVDHRADVYSLGASLYTMLTGRTSAELFVADEDDNLLADIEPRFRQVILTATRYRAEDRHPTVIAFRQDVMDALSDLPSSGTPPAPLAHHRDPLPATPPDRLADGTVFPELDELLAPPKTHESWEAPAVPEPPPKGRESVMAAIGYRMPERHKVRQPRRTLEPEYIVSEEGAYYTLPAEDITQNIARQVQAEVRQALEQDQAEPAGPLGIGNVATAILALAVAVFFVVAVTLVSGAGWVAFKHQSADRAASELLQALHAEGSVIFDLGPSQPALEMAYNEYRDRVGDERVEAALAFVNLLEQTMRSQSRIEPVARLKVNRLRAARDHYHEAQAAWESAAAAFPGSTAVRSNLATAPPPRPRQQPLGEAQTP